MRIVVAMSGGVDSSVAAALLVEEGHEVIGLSMQVYDASDRVDGERAFGSCCSIDDLHDARRVAAALGIPHYIVNFEREFDAHVVRNFVDEYIAGRTPLPCARCNSDLKFNALLERARGLGADGVATGHYARVLVDPRTRRPELRRGLDADKDQAYFLFSLTPDQLAHARFPVGGWTKADVRAYARAQRLPVADKPDSQEICFVPDHDYAALVRRRAADAIAPGPIVDEQGATLGRHDGIHQFTIGQRKGLGLSGGPQRAPLYVIALRPAAGEVVVGPKSALARARLTASGVNWLIDPPRGGLRVTAQIRHRHRPAPAQVRVVGDGRVQVVFDVPQIAVTPGQAVVFYDGDLVAGGGWIDQESAADDDSALTVVSRCSGMPSR